MLLGAPGSGKGTQAELITRQFGVPVTSPGAILRRERDLGTSLGMEAAEYTKQGGLVPDKVIVELIEDWLRLHGGYGFIFDGFPRTLPQAESLREILGKHHTPLDLAIWLDVSEETVRDRIWKPGHRAAVLPPASAMPRVRFYHQRLERDIFGAGGLPIL